MEITTKAMDVFDQVETMVTDKVAWADFNLVDLLDYLRTTDLFCKN